MWAKTREGESHTGWPFAHDATSPEGDPEFGCHPDPINGAKFVRDLYELGAPGATKFSVPVSE